MKWFIVLLALLSACDSPMNHRVRSDLGLKAEDEHLRLQKASVEVEIEWLVGPVGKVSFDNHLLVILKDAQGSPTSLPNGQSLSFYASMPSMGHPLDDPGFFQEISAGVYINKTIRFNMSGDWLNELWITDAQGALVDKVVWPQKF